MRQGKDEAWNSTTFKTTRLAVKNDSDRTAKREEQPPEADKEDK